jgi:hypothetical protein
VSDGDCRLDVWSREPHVTSRYARTVERALSQNTCAQEFNCDMLHQVRCEKEAVRRKQSRKRKEAQYQCVTFYRLLHRTIMNDRWGMEDEDILVCGYW